MDFMILVVVCIVFAVTAGVQREVKALREELTQLRQALDQSPSSD